MKPAGPIIIDNPVDYQLAIQQQQQQIILGQKISNELPLSNPDHIALGAQYGSDEDAKHIAEFLKPKTSTDKSKYSLHLEPGGTKVDTYSTLESKDNKVISAEILSRKTLQAIISISIFENLNTNINFTFCRKMKLF